MGQIRLPDGEKFDFDGETEYVSDMYHTFHELYEHRIRLFIALCDQISGVYQNDICDIGDDEFPVWASKFHSDGTNLNGWFILGLYKEPGKQITYHLPDSYWDEVCKFARILPLAPTFDGHDSVTVLNRLKEL